MSASIHPVREARPVPPLGAFLEGWRRVLRAPAVVAGTVALIGAASRLIAIASSAPASQAADPVTTFPIGWSAWVLVLDRQLRSLTGVLAPEISAFLRLPSLPPPVVAALCVQAVLWMFLSGGILDRIARARPIRTAAFFAACGVYFFRFLRLAVLIGLPGWVLFQWQQWAADNVFVRASVLVAVALVSLIADFARVRAVVEGRNSMLGALSASVRFVRRRAGRVLVLALLNGLAMLAVLRIGFQFASTPAPDWLSIVFLITWLLLAMTARLAFLASEVAFFQGEVAHAGYTAAPLPVWPDSPAVEAIENLVKRVRA